MSNSKSKRVFVAILSVLALTLGTVFVVTFFMGGKIVKGYIERAYAVTMDSADFSLQSSSQSGGLPTDVVAEIKSLSTSDKTVFAKSVKARVNLFSVLFGDISELSLDGVVLTPKLHPETPIEIPDLRDLLGQLPVHIANLDLKDVSLHLPVSDLVPEGVVIKGSVAGSLSTPQETILKIEGVIPASAHTKGGVVSLAYDKGNLNLNAAVNEVRLPNLPLHYNVSLTATQVPGQPINFTGKITDSTNAIWLETSGQTDNLSSGQLTFDIPSIAITHQKMSLKQLGLDKLAKIIDYSFNLSGKGGLTWNAKGFKPSGAIAVKDGKLVTDSVVMTGLRFQLPVDEVFPRLQMKQDLHVDSITSPVTEVTNLNMSILASEEGVVLSKASWQVWDGSVYLSALQLSPMPIEQEVKLTLEHMSLEKLFSRLNIEKFSASGLLNGQIPLRVFEDGSIVVKDGFMKSTEPGHLSYQWDEALASLDQSLKLAGTAIQNFDYSELDIRVNKKLHQEPVLELDIKGRNPKLLEGRPFDIRINLSGKLMETLESMMQTFEADIKNLKELATVGNK